MATFKRKRRGAISVELEDWEAHMLRELLGQMRELLQAEDLKDPVIARLYPPAYDEAPDAEAYRELIGNDLKNSKLGAIDDVAAKLEGEGGPLKTSLSEDEFDAWLRVLTDLRLAIGTRLDVTEEMMDREPDPHDPDAPALSELHWLGWMQESMLRASMGGN
ncbi:MAG: hypothetical protein QOH90_1304 [Actinomycetota bacterium]|jgi:hypothetical protein|nr:hypothetical protein [Actinomycetota bacterium]